MADDGMMGEFTGQFVQYNTIADYEAATGNAISSFQQSPMLDAAVADGTLPPVEERLSDEPLVMQPADQIGEYGGAMRNAHEGNFDFLEDLLRELFRNKDFRVALSIDYYSDSIDQVVFNGLYKPSQVAPPDASGYNGADPGFKMHTEHDPDRANEILGETVLSFIGLSLHAPAISSGVLLEEAQAIRVLDLSPWLLLPTAFVVVSILAFNFVGDGLRDASDPYSHL